MAQTGYTPILIYSSSTTTNAPAAGNLTNSTLGSELAINITDGKLFYKDNSNNVQVIAWKTTPTSAGGTGLTSYTAGDLVYYASGTALTKLGIGTAYQALQVNAGATAPSWQPSATSVMTAQGDLLYASAANTLARLAKDTNATRYLANTGTSNNPAWAQINLANGVTGTLSTGNGGTGLTSFTANGVVYASSTSALTTGTGLQFTGINLGVNTTPSAWASTATAIQLNYGAALQTQHTGDLSLVHNAYEATANSWKFYGAGPATALRYHLDINNSFHKWYESSASGVAGGTITWTQLLSVARTKTLALEGATSQSGTGITFPATQSASSDVNTLDDYEEGSWTPTLTSFTLLGSQTATGTYTKIGRMVYLTVYVTNTDTITSVAGTSRITNLPFTPNTNNYAGVTNGNAGTIAALNHGGIVNAAGSQIYTPAFTVASGNPLALSAWYIV